MKLFNSCIIQQSFEQSPLPLQQSSKPPPQQLAATHIGMQMNAIGGNTPPRPQRPHKQHAEEQQGFDLDRFLRQKNHGIFQPVIVSIIATIFLKSINKICLTYT